MPNGEFETKLRKVIRYVVIGGGKNQNICQKTKDHDCQRTSSEKRN